MSTMIGVSGPADLADEILATLGQRAHRAEKARFLSATFELRIRLATQAHRADLVRALDRLPDRLEALWGDARYSARERRRILYELWSELDGTNEGQRAATVITSFIRKRLPCGAPDAYTQDEIDTFRRMDPERPFLVGEDCAP